MKSTSVKLAELLDDHLPPLPDGAVLVLIPTSPAHIHERGYDHMLLITKRLGSLRKVPAAKGIGS